MASAPVPEPEDSSATASSSLDGEALPRASSQLQKQLGSSSSTKLPDCSRPHASSSMRQPLHRCAAAAAPPLRQHQYLDDGRASPHKPSSSKAAATANQAHPSPQLLVDDPVGLAASRRRVLLYACNRRTAIKRAQPADKQQQHMRAAPQPQVRRSAAHGCSAPLLLDSHQAPPPCVEQQRDSGSGHAVAAAAPAWGECEELLVAATATTLLHDSEEGEEEQRPLRSGSSSSHNSKRHSQLLGGAKAGRNNKEEEEEGSDSQDEGDIQRDDAQRLPQLLEEEEEEQLTEEQQRMDEDEDYGESGEGLWSEEGQQQPQFASKQASSDDDDNGGNMEADPEDWEDDEYAAEEEAGTEEGRVSRPGGAALSSGDVEADGTLLPALPLAGFCRNCTSMLRPERWCALCGHHADDDEGLLDGRPAHVQQREMRLRRGLLGPPPSLTASAGLHAVAPAAASAANRVALVYDERMEQHEEGAWQPHPERPDRVRAVMARLLSSGLADQCVRLDCQEATLEQLGAVHSADLMEFVKAMAAGLPPPPGYPLGLLTPDTYINRHTYLCARLAAGGAAQVAASVARGEAAHGAAIIRPPGHHAESNLAMGFCFFNNAGVAARAAQAAGAQRVLILDFDVHHGNGTQHIFEDDPSVMYMSLHRWDNGQFYPGTGAPHEVGSGAGAGYTVNVAWNGGGLHNADYMFAFDRVLMPIARAFKPSLVIASAGFDAADGDPIGGCRLTPECFGHMTALLKSLAPLVMLLEGGYNLAATARSTEACLGVLLGQQPAPLPGPSAPSRAGLLGVLQALHVQRCFWPCVVPGYGELCAALLQREQQQRLAQAQQLEARRPCVAQPPAPPRPRPAQAAPGALQTDQRRREVAQQRRRLALLGEIRKRARRAWWARHQRLALLAGGSRSAMPTAAAGRQAGGDMAGRALIGSA